MATQSDEIKRLVRERYGSRAKGVIQLTVVEQPAGGEAACCSPADMDRALRLYNEGQLAGLPARVHRGVGRLRQPNRPGRP